MQATQSSATQKTCVGANAGNVCCDYMKDEDNSMVIASIEKSIQISEEKLREKNERLQVERKLFEMKK